MRALRPHDVVYAPGAVTFTHTTTRRLMTDQYVLVDLNQIGFDPAYVPRGQGTYTVHKRRPFTWLRSDRGSVTGIAAFWERHTETPGMPMAWTPWTFKLGTDPVAIGSTADERYPLIGVNARIAANLVRRGCTFMVSPVVPTAGRAPELVIHNSRGEVAGVLAGVRLDEAAEYVDRLAPLANGGGSWSS